MHQINEPLRGLQSVAMVLTNDLSKDIRYSKPIIRRLLHVETWCTGWARIIIIIIIIIVLSVFAHFVVNPCLNGGLSLSSRFGYHCLCSKDYHGRFCDGM